jgi:hypothetical protein
MLTPYELRPIPPFAALGAAALARLAGRPRDPIRRHDPIACPPVGAAVSPQYINTGPLPRRDLALSRVAPAEACEYPGQVRVGVAGRRGPRERRAKFRAQATADGYDREQN